MFISLVINYNQEPEHLVSHSREELGGYNPETLPGGGTEGESGKYTDSHVNSLDHGPLWSTQDPLQQARQGSTLDICNLERSFPVGTAARVTSSRLYNSEISFKGHRSMCTVNCVWRMEW